MTTNLQKILNALNYKNMFGKDLDTDGKYGRETRDRLLLIVINKHTEFVTQAMNMAQANYYLDRAIINPNMRKYYKGWMKQRCLN